MSHTEDEPTPEVLEEFAKHNFPIMDPDIGKRLPQNRAELRKMIARLDGKDRAELQAMIARLEAKAKKDRRKRQS